MDNYVREGYRTVTPRIVTRDVAGLVAFIQHCFGGHGELQEGRPCELHLGDALILISGVEARASFPAFLYLYVPDADESYERAVGMGAKPLEAPLDTPYGDRRAMIEDAWGNVWQLATCRSR